MSKIACKMPKISFIITSYNYATYIGECIESIINQSYRDFEILIIDDASEDNSVKVIERYMRHYKGSINITLIRNEANIGQLGCIFKGIEFAKGEFISCVDADDLLAPDFAMNHIILHLNMQTALTVCEMVEVDENLILQSVNSPENPILDENITGFFRGKMQGLASDYKMKKLTPDEFFFGGWWWAPLTCAVFRRDAVMPLLMMPHVEHWKKSADKIILNFLHLIGGSVKIYCPLVYYRKHAGNSDVLNFTSVDGKSNKNKAKNKYLKNEINLYKDVLNLFVNNKEAFQSQYSERTYHNFISSIIKSVPKLIVYNLRNS